MSVFSGGRHSYVPSSIKILCCQQQVKQRHAAERKVPLRVAPCLSRWQPIRSAPASWLLMWPRSAARARQRCIVVRTPVVTHGLIERTVTASSQRIIADLAAADPTARRNLSPCRTDNRSWCLVLQTSSLPAHYS